jgi:site-specific DNA-methyltransferase (adenine-specific)
MGVYYQDGNVTLYLGDCREELAWLEAHTLCMDPPYGIGYGRKRGTWAMPQDRPAEICGDEDTALRDEALALWKRHAIVFGDLKLQAPAGTRKILVYRKPPDAGTHGALAGFRHDVEAVYLVGKGWLPGWVACPASLSPAREQSATPPAQQPGTVTRTPSRST